MDTFKIEKNVPLLPTAGWKAKKYPLGDMKVGDSFFVIRTKDQSHLDLSFSITPAISYYGKRHNKKFSTRKREENGVLGIRVWRVK